MTPISKRGLCRKLTGLIPRLLISSMTTSQEKGEQYDYIFKFIIIGDAGAGKSCILHQFIEGKHKKSSSHTIGVEFGSKIIQVGDNRVKLQVWDTAGQDRTLFSFSCDVHS